MLVLAAIVIFYIPKMKNKNVFILPVARFVVHWQQNVNLPALTFQLKITTKFQSHGYEVSFCFVIVVMLRLTRLSFAH